MRRLAFDKSLSDAAFRALLTGGDGRQKSDGREARRLAAQLAKVDDVQSRYIPLTPEASQEEIIRLNAAVRLMQVELLRLQHGIEVGRALSTAKGKLRAAQLETAGVKSVDQAFALLAEFRAADPEGYEVLRTIV